VASKILCNKNFAKKTIYENQQLWQKDYLITIIKRPVIKGLEGWSLISVFTYFNKKMLKYCMFKLMAESKNVLSAVAERNR